MQKSDSGNIEIEAAVKKIIFQNETNGYTVAVLKSDDGNFTAVGTMPGICEGEFVIICGYFDFHDNYGEQFKIVNCKKSEHKTEKSIIKYLSQGFFKGLGVKTAKRIVDIYGTETMDVIKNEPQKIALIKGITMERALEYSSEITEREKFSELFMFLSKYDISPSTVIKASSVLGEDAKKIIENNPYILFDSDTGIKFRQTDEIAFDLGFKKDCEQRIITAIYAICKNALLYGHTCMKREAVLSECSKLLGIKLENKQENIEYIKKSEKVLMISQRDEIALKTAYYTEKGIAEKIRKKLKTKIGGDEREIKKELSDILNENNIMPESEQIDAMCKCITSPFTVITGGPGTGKTTLLYFLYRYMARKNKKTALCSPTGRAAKRMQEITGFEAKTIHRLLDFKYKSEIDDFDLVFSKDASNPVDADMIIVDEASMVDVFLMRALLEATCEDTQIVLIGDTNQLPAVGAGNALKDIIDSGSVESVVLKTVHRQKSGGMIALNSHSILEGVTPSFGFGKNSECVFIHENTDKGKNRAVMELYDEFTDGSQDIDFLKDIQVLTPTKRGVCGTRYLNEVLQKKFTGPKKSDDTQIETQDMVLKKGDKVIQTRNNYDISWEMNNDKKSSGKAVLNGEIGYVADIDSTAGVTTIIFDEERIVHYNKMQANDIELAYAITVHKSQGSEYPIVILPLPNTTKILMTRNLLYTAFSRAKSKIFVIGEMRTIEKMIENRDVAKRCTLLEKFLDETL